MGDSLFDDIMVGAVVAKHVFRGASKAFVKAKEAVESEKGQQIRAELRAKANEAMEIAGDKAREMGLDEKVKTVLGAAGDIMNGYSGKADGSANGYPGNAAGVILDDRSRSLIQQGRDILSYLAVNNPEVLVDAYIPGSYTQQLNAMEQRIIDATEEHNRILNELREGMANEPEYIEPDEEGYYSISIEDIPGADDGLEQKIREEEDRFGVLCDSLQRDLEQLIYELQDAGVILENQRLMQEEEYEEQKRRENERDWLRFLGKDPDR